MNIESKSNKGVENLVIFLNKACEKVYFFDKGITEIPMIKLPNVCWILNSNTAQYKIANIPEITPINITFAEVIELNNA